MPHLSPVSSWSWLLQGVSWGSVKKRYPSPSDLPLSSRGPLPRDQPDRGLKDPLAPICSRAQSISALCCRRNSLSFPSPIIPRRSFSNANPSGSCGAPIPLLPLGTVWQTKGHLITSFCHPLTHPQLGLDDSTLLQELHAAQQRFGFGDPSF